MAAPLSPAAALPASVAAPSTAAANTYSDLNGLAALKKDPQSPQTLHAVSQQVDALFLQMMLKSMRDASADAGDPQSNEMGMYQDMFDKQVSLSLSQHGGLGLGNSLLRPAGSAAPAASAAGSSAVPAVHPLPPRPASGMAAPGAGSTPGDAPVGGTPVGGAPVGGTPAGATTGALATTPGEFVSRVMPAIRTAAAALGLDPLGLLAQAAVESGWGQRMPRTASGASSLNLFGIKADGGWDGQRAAASSLEYSDGVATPKRAAFRAYGSIEDSVNDFAKLLGSSLRYRETLTGGATAAAYAHQIAKAGYATDPAYADKITQMLHSKVFQSALRTSGVSL